MRAAVADPNLTEAQVAGLFIGILSGRLTGDAENFVRVLAENGRLGLLPEIRAQFEALKNEREGVLEAEVHVGVRALRGPARRPGAAPREEDRAQGQNESGQVDKDLIAGVRVVLGDKVIDGSARAQLGALETALKA